MSAAGLEWYWRRLRCMSAPEMARRAGDRGRQWAWRRRQVHPGQPWPSAPTHGPRRFSTPLPPDMAPALPEAARQALADAAAQVLEGRWELLGVPRRDVAAPDWFLDPVTGRRAPRERYAFAIDHRSEDRIGNVKQIWELSRHHHLTLLSAAWLATGDERYAETVDRQLRGWWRENPFLSGVHWTSGIELAIRLIAWTWIRRLLGDWPGVTALFEENGEAACQLYWHQSYLFSYRSTGSSANNHVVAEAAGLLTASCAFPWFRESDRWRETAAAVLERELERNTFPSGVNRELASDYHRLVAELGLVAAVEAEAAGHPLGDATWARLCRTLDAAAAVVDERVNPPRQGDGDDGQVLLVDAPAHGWSGLLAAGARLFGPAPWWPATRDDVRSTLVGALAPGPRAVAGRPGRRPSHFGDAGLTLLRTTPSEGPEIWCRCDGGPHGFLSLAAHAHADALSIEVRHGGTEVLADPGTYCYHGDPPWRAYFRSTIGHNTLELDGHDQSQPGGPFLWLSHASTRLGHVELEGPDGIQSWAAEHDGYCQVRSPALHRRTVRLDRGRRRLEVVDRVQADWGHRCRLAFHLGPSVLATLDDATALLTWPTRRGSASATLQLPDRLRWTAHRGQTDPILGWYSPRFGHKQPTVTLVGSGTCGSDDGDLVTVLQFSPLTRGGATEEGARR